MDRELQDELIRYLAEPARRRGATLALNDGEAVKAERFARFLARRYYRDRLHRSFRYAPRLAGRNVQEAVDSETFEGVLAECVLGSFTAAQAVGEMAVEFLARRVAPPSWWRDLLEYERAYFLQAATSESGSGGSRPVSGVSAACRNFEWNMPALLARLKSGEAIDDRLRTPVTLIFSRAATGRMYVVEADEATAAVFRAADGKRDVAEIARVAGVSEEAARSALGALAGIGAVLTPASRAGVPG